MRRLILAVMALLAIYAAPSAALAQVQSPASKLYPFYPSTTAANHSYLRFVNPVISPANITVDFLDYNTQAIVGTCVITVPGLAAPQFSAIGLESCAGMQARTSASILSLNLGATGVYFQNVIWN